MSKTPGDPGLRWRDRPLGSGDPEDRAAAIIRGSLPARAPEDVVLARIERRLLAEPLVGTRSPLFLRLALTALFLVLGGASVKAYEYARRAGWIGTRTSMVSPASTAKTERPRKPARHGAGATRSGPGSTEPAPVVFPAAPAAAPVAPTPLAAPQPSPRVTPTRVALIEDPMRRPSAGPRGAQPVPVPTIVPGEQPTPAQPAAPNPSALPSLSAQPGATGQTAPLWLAPTYPTSAAARGEARTHGAASESIRMPGQGKLATASPSYQNSPGRWQGGTRLEPPAAAPQPLVPTTGLDQGKAGDRPLARPGATPQRSTAIEEARALDQALVLLRRQRDATAALAALEDYLRRYPHGLLNHEARVARVDALLLLDRSDDALIALDGLPLDGKRRSTELQVIRAELRARSRCSDAAADFTTALSHSRDPRLIERILYGRGSCRAKLGDRTGAAQDLRLYLERFPLGPRAAWARQWLASFDGSTKSGG